MKAVSAESPKDYQLKAMKRQKNINIQSGDMFAVQAINGTFYVGQVLLSDLPTYEIDPFIKGCHVIVIFGQIISSPNEDVTALPLDYYRLLIKPCIVEETYWKRGYFPPLMRRSVPSLDSLSYGFWSYRKQAFQTVKGGLLETPPKIYDDHRRCLGNEAQSYRQRDFVIADKGGSIAPAFLMSFFSCRLPVIFCFFLTEVCRYRLPDTGRVEKILHADLWYKNPPADAVSAEFPTVDECIHGGAADTENLHHLLDTHHIGVIREMTAVDLLFQNFIAAHCTVRAGILLHAIPFPPERFVVLH